jgi:hypothetical protein
MKRYTWAQSARRHEMVFNRALGITPEMPASEKGIETGRKKVLSQANP